MLRCLEWHERATCVPSCVKRTRPFKRGNGLPNPKPGSGIKLVAHRSKNLGHTDNWMGSTLEKRDASSVQSAGSGTCSRCGRPITNRSYAVHSAAAEKRRCLRCTVIHPSLVRRSAAISLIVGTLLTLINQYGALTNGTISASLAWKVPLNYAVPYTVATVSAVLNARVYPENRH